MSYASRLIAAKNKAAVKFIEYTRAVARYPDHVICFFEGEDCKYYSVRFNIIASGLLWQAISCDGKQVVLEIREIIDHNSTYKNKKFAFFIDKDFDWNSSTSCERTYETPTYSIENFYCSAAVFRQILQHELKISEFDGTSDFEACFDLFDRTQKKFHDEMRDVTYWICAHRWLEKTMSAGTLNLGNVKLSKLVDIELDSVSRKYDIPDLYIILEATNRITADQLSEASWRFVGCDPTLYFRGKYEIEFLRCFIEKLKADRESACPSYFSSTGKVKLSLNKDNIISELSQYAETPSCLPAFLDSLKDA